MYKFHTKIKGRIFVAVYWDEFITFEEIGDNSRWVNISIWIGEDVGLNLKIDGRIKAKITNNW